jgi:hypothetical protein
MRTDHKKINGRLPIYFFVHPRNLLILNQAPLNVGLVGHHNKQKIAL